MVGEYRVYIFGGFVNSLYSVGYYRCVSKLLDKMYFMEFVFSLK